LKSNSDLKKPTSFDCDIYRPFMVIEVKKV